MKRIFLLIAAALFLLPATINAQEFISHSLIIIEEDKIEEDKKEHEGYFQQSADIEIGSVGNVDFKFAANYIAGYRFNDRFFLGGGAGYSILNYSGTTGGEVQLFANSKLYLIKNKRWQPLIDFSAGMISGSERGEGIWVFINPQIGVNHRINDKTSVYLSFGAQITPGYYDDSCLQLKIGVTF